MDLSLTVFVVDDVADGVVDGDVVQEESLGSLVLFSDNGSVSNSFCF